MRYSDEDFEHACELAWSLARNSGREQYIWRDRGVHRVSDHRPSGYPFYRVYHGAFGRVEMELVKRAL